MTWLVVGIGNPGERYRKTRHNVGAEVIALLAARHGAPKPSRQGHANVSRITLSGQDALLAVTRTYVNDSGPVVQSLMARNRISDLSEVLVIVDDMELQVGVLRMRPGGSDGGHNGLKSIIRAVGGTGFPRLRLGIGRPPAGQDPIEHVLGHFPSDERATIDAAEARAADAVEHWVENGIADTMNKFNGMPPVDAPE